MSYIWESIKTRSYWKYAIWSIDAGKTFFAVLGVVWMIFEILDSFSFIQKENLPGYTVWILAAISFIVVVVTRRPVKKVIYQTKSKDLSVEVRIADLFDIKGQKVISTNSTFDTDTATGIIALNSLQGQFTQRYYPTNIAALDNTINLALNGVQSIHYPKISGKDKKYPIGTTVRVDQGPEVFYLLAMSDLNFNNTAGSTFEQVIQAVDSVFDFIVGKGENTDIVVPLIGKGRGSLTTNRKRLIARIAQAFIKASEQNHFSNKLIIAIHPKDAENFGINLHEVRDLLQNYLP